MSKKKRKTHTPAKKAEILRRHLADKIPVSDLCDEYKIQPSMFYAWQRQALAGLESFFEEIRGGKRASSARDRELARFQEKIDGLEARITRKDTVIAEISEEHITLKKSLGEI
jgi:transposase-like protein